MQKIGDFINKEGDDLSVEKDSLSGLDVVVWGYCLHINQINEKKQ